MARVAVDYDPLQADTSARRNCRWRTGVTLLAGGGLLVAGVASFSLWSRHLAPSGAAGEAVRFEGESEKFDSFGPDTACRLSESDDTADGQGTAQVMETMGRFVCKMTCVDKGDDCYGVEYIAESRRCELWTKPIEWSAGFKGAECLRKTRLYEGIDEEDVVGKPFKVPKAREATDDAKAKSSRSADDAEKLESEIVTMQQEEGNESSAVGSLRQALACQTPKPNEHCYRTVKHAILTGIHEHPDYYKSLTPSSPWNSFQNFIAASKEPGGCMRACPQPGPKITRTPFGLNNCLCVFDVDRTVTGKQGKVGECQGNMEVHGVRDKAYEMGTLVLSQLGYRGLKGTFCEKCFRGIVTAGDVRSGEERKRIYKALGGFERFMSEEWSDAKEVTTQHPNSIIVGATDGRKQETVRFVQQFFQHKGIRLDNRDVHFFDDRAANVLPFLGTEYNARQVSCPSRDGEVGMCGAATWEIVDDKGVFPCGGPLLW